MDQAQQTMADELARAWRTNCAINHLLIEGVSEEGWDATLSKRGGRGVVGELAHMHTNRVWQLEKRAGDLAVGLAKYAAKDHPSRAELAGAMIASDKAVEGLLVGQLCGEPKRRGFKRGVLTTLAYFIAHESHHRGRILLTLKVSGNTLDKGLVMKLWDWDRIE